MATTTKPAQAKATSQPANTTQATVQGVGLNVSKAIALLKTSPTPANVQAVMAWLQANPIKGTSVGIAPTQGVKATMANALKAGCTLQALNTAMAYGCNAKALRLALHNANKYGFALACNAQGVLIGGTSVGASVATRNASVTANRVARQAQATTQGVLNPTQAGAKLALPVATK